MIWWLRIDCVRCNVVKITLWCDIGEDGPLGCSPKLKMQYIYLIKGLLSKFCHCNDCF